MQRDRSAHARNAAFGPMVTNEKRNRIRHDHNLLCQFPFLFFFGFNFVFVFVFFFLGGVRFGSSCIIISKLQYHDQHALMAVIMSCSELF